MTILLEENFKWHLEAFASELFIFNMHTHLNLNIRITAWYYLLKNMFMYIRLNPCVLCWL